MFLNIPLDIVDGEASARYPHLLDFYISLADGAERLDLCAPVRRAVRRHPDYGVLPLPANVRLLALPHWSSAPMLARRIHLVVPAALRIVLGNIRGWDAVGAVAPSVVGNLFLVIARVVRRPAFMLVRGEKQRTVRLMMGTRSALPFIVLLRLMELWFRRFVRAGVPAFVAGGELLERYEVEGARIFDFYPALSRDFPIRDEPRPPRADGPLRLVTVARLSAEKGLDDLLAALAELGRDGVPVRLDIVGEGPERAALEGQARELGLSADVRLHGFVPHGDALVALLDAADVFVLPSRSEGVPHSAVEAMSRGLPVVATAVGGLPGLLARGGGVVVAPRRPDELARAVRRLSADPAARLEMSRRALATAERYRPAAQRAELRRHLAQVYPGLPWA